MSVYVECSCGLHYNLKNQYAGRLLECPSCGSVFRAPGTEISPLFERDIFQLREKHFAIDTKYHVRDDEGRPILYVERPAKILARLLFFILLCLGLGFGLSLFKTVAPGLNTFFITLIAAYFIGPRRHIYFYADENKKEVLLTVTQDYIVQFPRTRYTLFDNTGQPLAVFQKHRLTDFWRKRWLVYSPDGHLILVASEDSIILSMLRRLTGMIIDIAVFRTNFVLYGADGQQVLGEFNRKMTLFDRYTLDLSEDPNRSLDRRIALALGVLLDTGEGR